MTKNMLKNDKFNFILALLLAVALWFYVMGVENPPSEITVKGVPIDFVNEETLPQRNLVWLSANTGTVDVTISGQHSDTTRVGKDDIKVVADLSSTVYGEQSVKLTITAPKNVDVEASNYEYATVFIDQMVTEAKSVEALFINEIEEGKEARTVSMSLSAVNVSGAKTLVDRVANLSAVIDTTSLTSDVQEFIVDLKAVDHVGNPVDKVTLAQSQVVVNAVLLNTKTVPLEVPVIGLDAEDAERSVILPETITVKGTEQALSAVEAIKAETVNVAGIYQSSELEVDVILPAGVELADDSQNPTMTVVVKALETKEFMYSGSDILIENLDDGFTVDIGTESIKLVVTGKSSVIAGLTAEDFSLAADVSGLGEGEEQVKLECRHEASVAKTEINPKEITVKIESLDEEEDSTASNDAEAEE